MRRIAIVVMLLCVLAVPGVLAGDKQQVKVLNNLVSELMNVRERRMSGRKKVDFMNPRDGWCFFVVSGKATVRLNEEKKPLVAVKAGGQSAEAMRHLPAGEHTLHIEGRPSNLIVRSIPVLQHTPYEARPWLRPHGPYDWEFLRKDVLPNVNVMISASRKPPQPEDWVGDSEQGWYARKDHLEEWTGKGRGWITSRINPFRKRDDVSADEAYEFWAVALGLNHPLMDGIIIDEFGGGDQPKYGAFAKAVERIYANPKFKGKTYSPYTFGGGILSHYKLDDLCVKFARACIDGGGYLCIERYLREQSTLKEAESNIREKMLSGWNMPRYEKDFPGIAKRMVMVLGCLSAVGESLNVDPSVDFKVYLDMQMKFLATEPIFRGLGGIQMYHVGYADEETVRWVGRLYRHYCIEGKKKLLSDELGFKYELDHIKNPDFAEGTKGWKIEAAEPGSITTKNYPKYGFLQFRYGGVPPDIGDTFLLMKRSAGKANVFSQQIKNLKPGRVYSLKMVTGDYADLVREIQEKKLHAVSVNLENVEILPGEKKSFQYIFYSHYARPSVGRWGANLQFYMNYHWRVFRAKGTTARLTVSDWEKKGKRGGPTGQELMFNFIEVQPYLEE